MIQDAAHRFRMLRILVRFQVLRFLVPGKVKVRSEMFEPTLEPGTGELWKLEAVSKPVFSRDQVLNLPDE
jgi:hypothetical protein